jgi:hypothetical protein
MSLIFVDNSNELLIHLPTLLYTRCYTNSAEAEKCREWTAKNLKPEKNF